jgi:hypothetical protein
MEGRVASPNRVRRDAGFMQAVPLPFPLQPGSVSLALLKEPLSFVLLEKTQNTRIYCTVQSSALGIARCLTKWTKSGLLFSRAL